MAKYTKHVGIGVFCSALAIASHFISFHEGNSLKSYQDIGGVWTACGGVSRVPANSSYTKEQCLAMTGTAIYKFMSDVANLVPSNTTPETLAADADFAYNLGIGTFKNSKVLKLQLGGKLKTSCDYILHYPNAGGLDCRVRSNNCYGVWQRRLDERELCLKGIR